MPYRKKIMFVCFTVFTFIAVCILSSCTKTQPAPLINEFVSSNTTDSKLLYQDWIEIYNPGNEAVNLSGYGLSDDLEKPFKWTFPDTTIEPSAYLLIIASGKNKSTPGKKLHCNWKINASGEILLLTDKQGKSIDRIEPVRLLPDISYGRVESADSSYKYFKQPTPGSENTSSAYNEILEQVKFSHKGGFYSDSFYLSLKHSDTDATIYYTLDGSEPSPSNTEGRTFHYKTSYLNKKSENNTLTGTYKTYKYDQPILIKNNSNSDPTTFDKVSSSPPELLIELLNLLGLFKNAKFNKPNLELFKGTIVRAIAVKDSSIPCPISSNSYFVSPDARQRLLPIVALGIQEDQLIGYEDGIYTPGIDFDQWLTENPDNEFLSFNDANYHRRGKKAEYRANIEYFDSNSDTGNINQIIGLRIQGGNSRMYPLKSFRIYAKNAYGKSRLKHGFFDGNEIKSYKRLILRNGGDDQFSTYLRDPIVHLISKPLNFDIQGFQPAILFINAEYFGVYNIRERQDKHYIAQHHNANTEDIILVKEPIDLDNITDSSTIEFINLKDYVIDKDLSIASHYEYASERIDIQNLIDYSIANIFVGNGDWPERNSRAWRVKPEAVLKKAAGTLDGKWRWIMFDVDEGLGMHMQYYTDSFDYAVNYNILSTGAEWNTISFYPFLNNDDFKLKFINRFCDLLNTAFDPERTLGIIDSVEQMMEAPMQEHYRKWSFPDLSISKWKSEIKKVKNYVVQRPAIQRNHLKEYFQLQDDVLIHLNVSDTSHGYIKINSIKIDATTAGIKKPVYPWSGKYFRDVPVTISAVAKAGFKFSHWEGISENEASATLTFKSNTADIKAIFVPAGKE